MTGYIVRRLALSIPALLLVSLIVFSLLRLVPGDTVMAMLGDTGLIPKANLVAVRHQLGLDAPFIVQYLHWIGGVLHGDLGHSLITKRSVLSEFTKALPVTLELALLSLSLSLLIAVPLGILAAVKHNSPIDHIARVVAVCGIAMPDFWLGTMVILGLSLWFHYLPPVGFASLLDNPLKNLQQLWLPVLIVGFRLTSVTTRMMRSMMLDVLHQDYVRTATAKGLGRSNVLIRHATKNALIPVVTLLGNQFAALMAGAVVMETLFSLPGIGQLTLNAISRRDYSQIQGNVLLLATLVIFVNLAVDLAYGWLDPRVRFN